MVSDGAGSWPDLTGSSGMRIAPEVVSSWGKGWGGPSYPQFSQSLNTGCPLQVGKSGGGCLRQWWFVEGSSDAGSSSEPLVGVLHSMRGGPPA